MTPNPFLGVLFHWLGGLAAGSFYVPYRGVRQWAWEVYWLVGGVFSWIIAPWVLASLNTRDLFLVLQEAPPESLWWGYFWGVMWGIGGLTFGLSMRYLGLSLGMGVSLGYCAAFGTLLPPIFHGSFGTALLGTPSGRVILLGVGVCLGGIFLAALAGIVSFQISTHERRARNKREPRFQRKHGGVWTFGFGIGTTELWEWRAQTIANRPGSPPDASGQRTSSGAA